MPNATPNYPALKLLQVAADLLREQRYPEAEARFQEVLAHEPGNVLALHRLSVLAFDRGDYTQAKQLLERALQLEPDNRDLLVPYGQMLHETSEPRAALNVFLRVLSLNSAEAEVWNAAGICLQEISQPASAIEFYLRAIALQPRFAEAHNNLGVVLTREGDYEGAIEHFRQALKIDPASAECHGNLAVAYRQRFEYQNAIASFREAVRLRPENAQYTGALGEALSLIYDPAAEATLRRGVELLPSDPDKHWNLALDLLKHGNYTEGLREFEWRWQRIESGKPPRSFGRPLWSGHPGQDLQRASILLHAEQGFGDTIQFLRYLPGIVARAAQVYVEVQPELHRLVLEYARQMPAPVAVLARGEPLPRTDWHVPLMSLAFACGSTRETLPPPRRLTARPAARTPEPRESPNPEAPLDVSAAPSGPFRVGLAWAGNPLHGRDRERSIPFRCLEPLFEQAGCSWVSLQTGAAAAQAGAAKVAIEQPALNDFLDTADILDSLDLVICADTAVAHLAATQGVPTWILLPFVGDWRWLQPPAKPGEAAPNPWYPQARIFRQAELPDGRPQAELWQPVLAQVAAALQDFVASA